MDLTAATVGSDLALNGSHSDLSIGGTNGAVRIGPGSYYNLTHGIAPNGGGSRVNIWSVVIDFKTPSLGSWHCFYQTDTANGDDGDCFINPSSAIGVSATGYSAYTLLQNIMYRMVIAVDNSAGRYDIYLDGTLVLDGNGQPVDGRTSLDTSLLLFADNNSEDAELHVAAVSLYDHALSGAEVKTLSQKGAEAFFKDRLDQP